MHILEDSVPDCKFVYTKDLSLSIFQIMSNLLAQKSRKRARLTMSMKKFNLLAFAAKEGSSSSYRYK